MRLLKHDTGITAQDIDRLTAKALAFEPPEDIFRAVWPLTNRYFSPTVIGLDKLPDKPTLFVGNHALFGIDILVFLIVLHHQTGRFARVLGDQFFFASPVGEYLMKYGWILADKQLCGAMMEAGEDLLVFPGGAAESTQAEAEKYTLRWGERYGFVRMAAEHGYDITPFGLVGPDDCYNHLREGNELLSTWPGSLLGKLGIAKGVRDDLLPPITRGLLATQLPKPQPSFLAFGDPVVIPSAQGTAVPRQVLVAARSEAARKIEGLISDMLLLRAQSTGKSSLLRHLLLS